MTVAAPKYDFDNEFQVKIAALVLRDPVFNQRTIGLIEPQFLTSSIDGVFVNIGLNYFKAYKRCPGLPILARLIKAAFDRKLIRPDQQDDAKERLGELLREDIGDRDFIIDEVASFAKHQALEFAILTSAELLPKREFDKIAELIKKAGLVGKTEDLGEYDYFRELENRTRIRKERIAGILPPPGISTGYLALDELLKWKGWGLKELSVIMGGAKAGKTMALIEFAKTATLQKKNVLYVTLEVSAEIISERLDCNLSDEVLKNIDSAVLNILDKVAKLEADAGKLIIREFPSGGCRPQDIRRLLAYYAAKGIRFDMVVVDYLDIMAPDFRTQDPIENSKQVWVGCRAIAQEENLVMLSATQTNREGYKATTSRAEHVAEDFNKVRIVDLMISVNSTEEERAMGEARLYFAASRNQEGGFTLRIKQNMAKAKFLERVIGKE